MTEYGLALLVAPVLWAAVSVGYLCGLRRAHKVFKQVLIEHGLKEDIHV